MVSMVDKPLFGTIAGTASLAELFSAENVGQIIARASSLRSEHPQCVSHLFPWFFPAKAILFPNS